ncbi:MAG: DnaD domain protein [Oscillospiraceae bacterium]|nr:DnaD domain protein [Oscillospiraceae bacterium]
MEFKISLGAFDGVFAVPNSVVDEYIKLASGDNLKVLMYCLRHGGVSLSDGEIARATGVKIENVPAVMEFWKQRGLLYSGQCTVDSGQLLTEKTTLKVKQAVLERDTEFSPKEIADTVKSNSDVEYLFKRCEELYGRPLKHNEMKALAVIVEDAGMKPEVAVLLVMHCFDIGKTSPAYMKKVAKSWVERDINTCAGAETEIEVSKQYQGVEGELKRTLRIADIPDKYRDVIRKWLHDFSFSVEIIYEAYQISLEKTGKLEYNYMDKVLSNWHVNGVKTVRDISKVNEKQKKEKQSSKKASFDLDEWEKQIMDEYED